MAARTFIAAFFIAALGVAALVGKSAWADKIERGVVVSIEAGEAYFDIAADRGVAAGRPVRLKRPVSLPHPITGKAVRDELPLGSGVVTLVGTALSMVKMSPDVAARVRVGDIVEALVESTEPPPAPVEPAKREALPPIPKVDPATAAALKTWNANIGSELEVKLAAWQRYTNDFPETSHTPRINAHIAALRALAESRPLRLIGEQRSVKGLEHRPRSRVRAGGAISIAIAVRDSSSFVGAWLHHRNLGDETFRRQTLRVDGDGYFRGAIVGDDVRGPGVEYFVEVATREGEAALGIGSPSDPVQVDIDEQVDVAAFRERQNRSRVSLSTDYLDYGTFDKRRDGELHRDRFLVVNADFLFRLRSVATRLWGIRVGLGTINGEGGFADEPMGESAGFNYGYTELEFRVFEESAVSARGVAGLGEDGLGFGLEARLRLGSEEGSNLSIGLSSLEEIGFLSEVRMQWAALPSAPLGLSVGVSDRPNRGDLGVRLGVDVGYRALSWIQPTLRVSYQGRSLRHSGLGVGAGMVFDW